MLPVDDWMTPGTPAELVRNLIATRYPSHLARLEPLLIRCELEDLQLLMAASPFVRSAGELEAVLVSFLEGDGELPAVMLSRLAPDDRLWASSPEVGALTLSWLQEARELAAESLPDVLSNGERTAC